MVLTKTGRRQCTFAGHFDMESVATVEKRFSDAFPERDAEYNPRHYAEMVLRME
jgi:hypothetical protein